MRPSKPDSRARPSQDRRRHDSSSTFRDDECRHLSDSFPRGGCPAAAVAVPCRPGGAEEANSGSIAVPLADAALLRGVPSVPPPAPPHDGRSRRFELLPGLWARLGGETVVDVVAVGCGRNDDDPATTATYDVTVLADKFVLGDLFLTGTNLALRARVGRRADAARAEETWDVMARNLAVSVEGLALGPLVDREGVMRFLVRFGRCGAGGGEGTAPRGEAADVPIPSARVGAFPCRITNDATVAFPECEGGSECTLRILLEYYCRCILIKMDQVLSEGGHAGAVGMKAAVADVTSVAGSAMGSSLGYLIFGPVGFVAGSCCGSKAGRKHSGAIVGAAAGAVLLGPAGLVAGACIGSRRDVGNENSMKKLATSATAGKASVGPSSCGGGEPRKGDGMIEGAAKAAGNYISSNKSELAGTTGVCAGAMAGAAVLGPVGIVPGALIGSMSGRTLVQDTNEQSSASVSARPVSSKQGNNVDGSAKKPYRFGDFTRSVVARGKESRGATREEGYKFGDFTRGLFK